MQKIEDLVKFVLRLEGEVKNCKIPPIWLLVGSVLEI
jgi:hypothetical protein